MDFTCSDYRVKTKARSDGLDEDSNCFRIYKLRHLTGTKLLYHTHTRGKRQRKLLLTVANCQRVIEQN